MSYDLITNYTDFNEFLKEVSIRNKSTKNLLGPNHGVIDKFVDFVVNKINRWQKIIGHTYIYQI